MEMEIDVRTISALQNHFRSFAQAQPLRVCVNGERHKGPVALGVSEDGTVTLNLKPAKRGRKPGRRNNDSQP